jgi:hypothetical protein
MSAMFSLPSQQIVNLNGVPLSGARLYFYEPATTTPKNVYSNEPLTILHPNPVVADASGRWPAIYMTEARYRVVLRDSSDVAIIPGDWTVDPGFGVNSGVLGIASGGTGASSAAGARVSLGITPQGDFVDVATSATMDIGAAGSDKIRATGVATVFSFGLTAVAGQRFLIRAVSSFVLKYNVISMILPGGVDATILTNDIVEVVCIGGGSWIVISITPYTRLQSDQRYVRFDAGQGLVAIQQAQARANIAAQHILSAESILPAASSIEFSIPSGVTEILFSMRAISLSGTDEFVFRLGNGGGIIVTSGYQSFRTVFDTTPSIPAAGFASSGLILGDGAMLAANTYIGQITAKRQSASNQNWIIDGFLMNSTSTRVVRASSFVSLSSELDSCRLASTISNTFDAGGVSLSWRF